MRDTSICGCKTRWSMVVNGVQYFGCTKPKGSLSFGNAGTDEDTLLTHMESVKERNRRLLLQDRIVQAGRKKVRSAAKRLETFSNHPQKLQTVEEEKNLGERGDSPDDSFVESDLVSHDQLREVEIIMRKKFRGKRTKKSNRVGRVVRQTCCGNTVRTKPRVEITLGSWAGPSWPVENIIRLYSCSASRYAMFKSNRRFKPGD